MWVNCALAHRVTLKANTKRPMIKQNHLPQKAIRDIEGVNQSLLDQGVLVETRCPCNTPILPFKSRPSR